MAERLAPGDYDQLHHFVAAGVWDASQLETELLAQADWLVDGSDAVLVIDDTAMPKKGTHSIGVAAQYASALGKTANCQTLVSLTLACGEVPVMVALRLPDSWISDRRRLERAGVAAVATPAALTAASAKARSTGRTPPAIIARSAGRSIGTGPGFEGPGVNSAESSYHTWEPIRASWTKSLVTASRYLGRTGRAGSRFSSARPG
jgi:hypothetical protein